MNSTASMDNEQLMLAYKETQDQDLKQELTLRYLDVVKKIAMQMRNVYLSFSQMDDIINEGVIAVMNGIDKYDPALNVKFETYITKRIRGLIIDLARKQDWVPRSVRQMSKEIDQAEKELYNRLGRRPSDEEVAQSMAMTLERYQEEVAKTSVLQVLSLDDLLDEMSDSVSMNKLEDDYKIGELPEDHYLHQELKEMLIRAIDDLKDREKLVVSLYYEQELNMKDIAKVLEISEARVSQIHAGALRKLRVSLENH